MHAAALPAAGLAVILSLAARTVLGGGAIGALATVVLAGGGAVALYLLLARLVEITEVEALLAVLRSRIRR